MQFWRNLFRSNSAGSDLAAIRAKIEWFRDLIAVDGKAMELINDAGEKLSGEYLFDMQYLRQLVNELEEALKRIVYDLNNLTDQQYPELIKVFDRLKRKLRTCLEGDIAFFDESVVLPLSELGQEFSDGVGEKMARLGDLYNHFPAVVPEGFAISTYACWWFLKENGIFEKMNTLLAVESDESGLGEQAAIEIQQAILHAKIPKKISKSILRAVHSLQQKTNQSSHEVRFAVRSSALGEDGDFTFAGLHKTLLNIPLDRILEAYKSVVASLFSAEALAYRRNHRLSFNQAYMGVGCLVMVPAKASGVLYSMDPMDPKSGHLVITAAPGYGKSVVEGRHSVDRFVLSRKHPFELLSKTIGTKETMYAPSLQGGVQSLSIPTSQRNSPCVSDALLGQLACLALHVERFMKCAQDIEWAIDAENRIFLLQSRPLRFSVEPEPELKPVLGEIIEKHPILFQSRGEVACRGIGAGRVSIIPAGEDTSDFPDGAVLVSQDASPPLSAFLSRASALITDRGTATGHLATLAREYRVPTLVNTSIATETLKNGMEITVDTEDNIVYQGIVHELLQCQLLRSSSYDNAAEFRILRRLLKYIAPLHLHDPQSSDFSADACRTYHDIIRFAHEKAVTELASSRHIKPLQCYPFCQRLEMEAPLDLMVIDIDTQDDVPSPSSQLTVNDITCEPLRAILEGLTAPGTWMTEPADMDFGSFMSSATGSLSPDLPLTSEVDFNLAIVSRNYLNLSLKLGYHYNVIDCLMSPEADGNYIYFRFTGGMTDVVRRSRRSRLIGMILRKCGFWVEISGDFVAGRVKDLSESIMRAHLTMMGRLIGFTRQLDIFLKSDDQIDYYFHQFFKEN